MLENEGQLVEVADSAESPFSRSWPWSESVTNSFVVSILMDIFVGRLDETVPLFGNSRRDRERLSLVLWMPSAEPRIILRAFSVARSELEYRRPMQKKNAMYKNVLLATTIDIREATAHKLVRKPVLTANRINLLIIVSDRWKPVRDRCRRVQSIAAISTSPAAAKAFTNIERYFKL